RLHDLATALHDPAVGVGEVPLSRRLRKPFRGDLRGVLGERAIRTRRLTFVAGFVAVRRIGGGASGLHGTSRLFPTLGACQGDRPLAVALRLRRYAARSLGLFSEL